MTGRLAGRLCVVTGAASGMGRATALSFSREGAIVIAADRDDRASRPPHERGGGSQREQRAERVHVHQGAVAIRSGGATAGAVHERSERPALGAHAICERIPVALEGHVVGLERCAPARRDGGIRGGRALERIPDRRAER